MASHHYFAFGLNIRSEISLPDVPIIEKPNASSDVTIRYSRVPEAIAEPQLAGVLYQANPDHYLLKVPGIANYHVYDGCNIDIQKCRGAEACDIRLFLMNTPFAALLQQRGVLVIQASAVMTAGSATAFAGCSGVGKSTFAVALNQHHYPLLTDELCAITVIDDKPHVWPGKRHCSLWRDACDSLGITPDSHQKLRKGIEKYQIEPGMLHPRFDPVPLDSLYILSVKHRTETTIENLRGREKIPALIQLQVNAQSGAQSSSQQPALLQIMRLASKLAIKSLIYERTTTGLHDLISQIKADLPAAVTTHSLPGNTFSTRQAAQESQPLNGPRKKTVGNTPNNIQLLPIGTQGAGIKRKESALEISERPLVWMASYPKSGNTWLRAFLSNYLSEQDTPLNINTLVYNRRTGLIASDRRFFDTQMGLKSSDLTFSEIDEYRPDVYAAYARTLTKTETNPCFIKIHDSLFRTPQKRLLVPSAYSLGVIYIVRNPLDVVVSYSYHSNITINQSIDILNDRHYCLSGNTSGLSGQLRQSLQCWSTHVTSWTEQSEIPVLLICYEDMVGKPEAVFESVLNFAGLAMDREKLQRAIENSQLQELKSQEKSTRFGENPSSSAFFRVGKPGSWKTELSKQQARRVVKAHSKVMTETGYIAAAGELVDR